MLKRRIIKRLSISTAALFAIFLICLIPDKKFNPSNEIIYANLNVKTSNIFLLTKNNKLAKTSIIINEDTKEDIAKFLIEVLIKDGIGESLIPNGFKSFIPSNTKINSIYLTDNIINIDFNNELLNVSKDKEEVVIEAIVYTLTSIDGIDGVTIYIDGNILNRLPQINIQIPPIINRNFGINKVYDITSLNNINHITTYYIDKNDDQLFYVPVTKYVNDDRDKIRIIIDDLTSNNIYNTDLMSYLNSNTELISVDLEDNIMQLVFNNYILDNFDEKNILEEVIYTICLSIKDNYNVDEVIFYVENEEIYKTVLKTIE